MATTKRSKGLGRGLENLLGPTAPEGSGAGFLSSRGDAQVPSSLVLSDLVAGRYQPRTRMDEAALEELAASIRSQGVMQPILVRPVKPGAADADGAKSASEGPRYEIIAGERRFRAAKLAGLDRVPVLVREVPDESAAVMALVENLQREDLNPLEEAQGLKRLVDEFGLTHEKAAEAVGRSRSAASNLLRLLQLTAPVQAMLMDGRLDMGHARALLALSGGAQVTAANQIVGRELNVREAERLVASSGIRSKAGPVGSAQKTTGSGSNALAREIAGVEEELADLLTAPVVIRLKKPAKGGAALQGEVVLAFESMDGLNNLVSRIRR